MDNTIGNILKLITLITTILGGLYVIANGIWKDKCSKKYGISKSYFSIKNKDNISPYLLFIILITPIVIYSIGFFYKNVAADSNVDNYKFMVFVIHRNFEVIVCMSLISLYMALISGSFLMYLKNKFYKEISTKTFKKIQILYIILSFIICMFELVLVLSTSVSALRSYEIDLSIFLFTIFIIMVLYCLLTGVKSITYSLVTLFLLNMCLFYYVFYALDILLYIINNISLITARNDSIFLTTANTVLGVAIIVVSFIYLIKRLIMESQYDKYKLLVVNESKIIEDDLKDFVVICEYENKFLSVRYENYGDELIVLYTDEYWFINPSDCTIKEKSFKREVVVKGNDKLKLSTLDAITRAEKNNIEELKYSREPIILYTDKETAEKSNIPQKDRHGLIINKKDYKIFKFKALLSDNNSDLNNEVLEKYNMCLIKKGFKLEDINNEMLGLDTEYVLWYLRYKNKFWIKKDTVNAYFVKNGMEISINEDNKNEPLPIYFKFIIVINDSTTKIYLAQKYMDIKTLCELLNITEQDIDRIENYESNMVIVQIVDKEKDTSNKNAIDKDTKTKPKEKSQSQNKAQKGNKNK